MTAFARYRLGKDGGGNNFLRSKQIALGDWLVEVDPDFNRRMFGASLNDWCQCERCLNWRVTRNRFAPEGLVRALSEMGIKLGDSFDDTDAEAFEEQDGWHKRYQFFIVPGQVLYQGETPIDYGVGSSAVISQVETRTERDARLSNLPDLAQPFFFIRTAVRVPWLVDEMLSFDLIEGEMCANCQQVTWMVSGRLTPTSRIPDWYGIEVDADLGDVTVNFCLKCGVPKFVRK